MSSLASTFLKPTQGDLSNYVLIHPIPPAVWAVGAQLGTVTLRSHHWTRWLSFISAVPHDNFSPRWNQQVEDWEKRQRQLQSPELFLKAPPNSSGGEKVKHFNFPVSAVANN